MVTGENHIGSDTAAIWMSSVMFAWETTSSCFFEKLKTLNVPTRGDWRMAFQSIPQNGSTRVRRLSVVKSERENGQRPARFRSTGRNGSRLRQLSAMRLPLMPWQYMARLNVPPLAPSA